MERNHFRSRWTSGRARWLAGVAAAVVATTCLGMLGLIGPLGRTSAAPATQRSALQRVLPNAPTLFVDPEQARRQQLAEGLNLLLEAEARSTNGIVSAHVRLVDGTEAGVEPDRLVPAASVIKLVVMAALYDAWENGRLKRTASDEKRLRQMITLSKNIVTNQLIERVGMERINAWLVENGFSQTTVRALILREEPWGPNLMTPRETTQLLDAIVRGEVVSPKASDEMRRLLLAQRWKERIPAGLPEGVTVGNKTGTMHDLLHDAAFVETPEGLKYSVAIFVERVDRSAVKSERIANISRNLHNYLVVNWRG